MKILITGFTGYVGTLIYNHFGVEHEIFGTSSKCVDNGHSFRCNLRDEDEVKVLSDNVQPDVVIHAAGQKDISFCESHVEEAFAINSLSIENVAKVFGGKSRIFYISTDYVFDGNLGNYEEDDAPVPLTVYGKSKLSGERQGIRFANGNFTIIRTAALYNEHSKFIEYLTDNLSAGHAVACFTDTFYSPTYYADLLSLITSLLRCACERQIYHVCGTRTSRYEFATLLAQAFNYDASLVRPAIRPSQKWYLLPDLSMTSSISQALLGHCPTLHYQALQTLAAKMGYL